MEAQTAAPVKDVAVFAPSIKLVSQTAEEWGTFFKGKDGARPKVMALLLCSDKPRESWISGYYDAAVGNTDPEVLRAFLEPEINNGELRIIFSTYQSAGKLKEVHENMLLCHAFCFAVFDEAHRAAGFKTPSSGASMALKQSCVRIQRRLFMTATPRFVALVPGKSCEEVASMDDEELFGKECFSFSYAHACEAGVIWPFEVVVKFVDPEKKSDFEWLSEECKDIPDFTILDAAKCLALARTVLSKKSNKALTFHSSIKRAEAMVKFLKKTNLCPGYSLFCVSSKTRPTDLQKIEADYRACDRAIMTNCKLWSEGVDCPDIDLVAVMDQEKSPFELTQMAGRAVRKTKNNASKKIAVILIPAILNPGKQWPGWIKTR